MIAFASFRSRERVWSQSLCTSADLARARLLSESQEREKDIASRLARWANGLIGRTDCVIIDFVDQLARQVARAQAQAPAREGYLHYQATPRLAAQTCRELLIVAVGCSES